MESYGNEEGLPIQSNSDHTKPRCLNSFPVQGFGGYKACRTMFPQEEQVKMQADQWAKEARNYALNLHCPHCKQVYSEFDGCMALECAHCHGHFCGYCHKALQSSRGAHDHVRECDANLTSNGSYYATADQIRDAQRRFRVKQLKKFFEEKKMKQRIRNALTLAKRSGLRSGLRPGLRPVWKVWMFWSLPRPPLSNLGRTLKICRWIQQRSFCLWQFARLVSVVSSRAAPLCAGPLPVEAGPERYPKSPIRPVET